MTEAPYLWDANAFIDVGERFYPDDVFGCLWANLRAAFGTKIVTVSVVLGQIKVTPEHAQAWRDEVTELCKPHVLDESTVAVQHELRRLANLVANDRMKDLGDVDTLVMATALANGLPVVTRDGPMIGESTKLRLDAVNPVEFFRRMGWKCR